MGGIDQCTLALLNGIKCPVHVDCLPLPSGQQFEKNHLYLYHRLEESMNRLSLSKSTTHQSVKPHLMPENLRAIVETAWTACTQDVSGDRIHSQQIASPFTNLRRSEALHPVAATQPVRLVSPGPTDPELSAFCSPATRKFTPRRTSLPSSSSSSSALPVSQDCLRTGATTIPWDLLFNLNLTTSNRRPLLRQRESYSASAEHTLPEMELYSPTNHSSGRSSTTPSLPKPMQVHKRQLVPRKQDAIYNARYKTQPCLHFQKYKRCPLGDNCHFAHGPDELLHPQMHPKYRTRICLNFAQTGMCPFGRQCYFLHRMSPSSIAPGPNSLLSCPNQLSRTNERHTVFAT